MEGTARQKEYDATPSHSRKWTALAACASIAFSVATCEFVVIAALLISALFGSFADPLDAIREEPNTEKGSFCKIRLKSFYRNTTGTRRLGQCCDFACIIEANKKGERVVFRKNVNHSLLSKEDGDNEKCSIYATPVLVIIRMQQ